MFHVERFLVNILLFVPRGTKNKNNGYEFKRANQGN